MMSEEEIKEWLKINKRPRDTHKIIVGQRFSMREVSDLLIAFASTQSEKDMPSDEEIDVEYINWHNKAIKTYRGATTNDCWKHAINWLKNRLTNK